MHTSLVLPPSSLWKVDKRDGSKANHKVALFQKLLPYQVLFHINVVISFHSYLAILDRKKYGKNWSSGGGNLPLWRWLCLGLSSQITCHSPNFISIRQCLQRLFMADLTFKLLWSCKFAICEDGVVKRFLLDLSERLKTSGKDFLIWMCLKAWNLLGIVAEIIHLTLERADAILLELSVRCCN